MIMLDKLFFLLALKDPFDELDFGITDSKDLQFTAASAYKLLLTIGITGLVITGMIAGVKLGWFNNSQKKADVKASMMFKLMVSIALFGFVTFSGIIVGIVEQLLG